MTLSSEQQLLNEAALGKDLAVDEWPKVLSWILPHLHSTVTKQFPPTVLPPSHVLASQPEIPATQLSKLEEAISQDDPTRGGSGDETTTAEVMPPPPVPSQTFLSSRDVSTATGLPKPLATQYANICSTLTTSFATQPPHTLQRLAELILYPRRHYRFLPSYLNALDRVTSVSSPTSHFPLPQARLPIASLGGGLVDADATDHAQSGGDLGSDASLGGALLTPIPWLRADAAQESDDAAQSPDSSKGDGTLHSDSTETIYGPHGAGTIESVSVTINGIRSSINSASSSTIGNPDEQRPAEHSDAALREEGGVTQGELLRQEQEAGIITIATGDHRANLGLGPGTLPSGATSESTGAVLDEQEAEMLDVDAEKPVEPEEKPHARGPEEMTVEDLGPQEDREGEGLDMAKAAGRSETTEGK